MSRRIGTFIFAAVTGMIGGSLAPHLFRVSPVHAQDSKPGSDIVEAKSFILIDGSGRKRGEWKTDNFGEPVLQMFDKQGRPIWEAGKVKVRRLRAYTNVLVTGRKVSSLSNQSPKPEIP